MNRARLFEKLLLFTALTIGSAKGDAIFSNLGVASNGVATIRTVTGGAQAFTWADEFLTPVGSSLTLQDVIIELGESSGTDSITAFLYSNTGTTPNTSLATIATVAHASIPSTPGQVTFTPGSTITLQANTEYWIVLSGTTVATNDAQWQLGKTETGTGLSGQNHDELIGSTWATFANDSFTNTIPEMEVDAASAVPEPTTFALVSAALLGLAGISRRRFIIG